jgi:hypothetical protein
MSMSAWWDHVRDYYKSAHKEEGDCKCKKKLAVWGLDDD